MYSNSSARRDEPLAERIMFYHVLDATHQKVGVKSVRATNAERMKAMNREKWAEKESN